MAKERSRKANAPAGRQTSPAPPALRSLQIARALSAAVIVLALMAGTYQRNIVWQSLLSLWQDCSEKSPFKSRSHNNLGNCYMLLGMHFDAIREYERAIELDPRNIEAYYNAAINLDEVGLAGRAIPYYEVFCKTNMQAYAGARDKACRRFEELRSEVVNGKKRQASR